MLSRRALLASPLALVGTPLLAQDLPGGAALADLLLAPGIPAGLLAAFTGATERRRPNRPVPSGDFVRELPAAPLDAGFRYTHEGESRSLDDYFARRAVTGLMVLRRGQVLVERYRAGLGPTTRFLSASMAKSVTGLLVGFALAEGRIRSIDDMVGRHAPGLAGTPWHDVPIRHVLEMASGVRFSERYDGQDDIAKLVAATVGGAGPGGAAALQGPRERRAAPGRLFAYSSADTQVLALVLSGALAPLTISEFLAIRLWQPMGAEAPASFGIDAAGQEASYGFLHARLRDYARLGALLADDGRVAGKQVVPLDWLRESTTASRVGQPAVASDFFGYGRQFWVFPGERRQFAMLGVRGQCVYVDPALQLVLAHTAVWPTVGDRASRAELLSMWRALVAHPA